MRKPTVFCCSMPMLYFRRNRYHITGMQFSGLFPGFLIPSSAVCTQKNLPASACGMMNMPIVATFRFKGHIRHKNRFSRIRQGIQIRITDKILCISRVRLTKSKQPAKPTVVFGINIFCLAESRPCIWPASVKRDMCEQFSHFALCNTVCFGKRKMMIKGRIDHSLCHKCCYGQHGANLRRESVTRPNLPE